MEREKKKFFLFLYPKTKVFVNTCFSLYYPIFQDPGLIEQFKVSIVSSNCHVNLLKILGISLLNLEREVLKWRDDDTGCREAADKLHRLAGEIAERIVRVYDYEADEFCVLNHGDTWATNFLFKDDCQGDDGASECKMVCENLFRQFNSI